MKRKFRLTLTEAMLGTKAANKEVFDSFIASKAPDEDSRKQELDTAEHREEAGTTVFHRTPDGKPGLWNYQIKGFMKDACGSLRNADGTKSKKLTSYKSKIDGLFFVFPRFIVINPPTGTTLPEKLPMCQRPLRAETMQGPRVSLVQSEEVPAGSVIEIEIQLLASKVGKGDDAIDTNELLEEWLNYGSLRGLGQWRNSGRGTFTWEEITDTAVKKAA